jgi:hypothetical protein
MSTTRIGGQSREVNDLLLSLKGLVLVRALLEDRGASEAEIREHGNEIERLRARLAELVREGGGAYSAAA